VVQHQPDRLTWLIVTTSAVIVAPLSEEFFFRSLLQGWFEKIELTFAQNPNPIIPANDATGESPIDSTDLSSSGNKCPHGILNLPLGSLPILASSLLFSLTHFGQGAAPIPLFVLALVLGFLYQRTHRLLPSSVVHFLLNASTMVLLFLVPNM